MRYTILPPFRRVMRPAAQPAVHEVHFHAGTDGRGFVCDHHRCESPRLTLREASLSH